MPSLIEDKLAIKERIAACNQSLNQGRYGDFLACRAEDGVFDGLGGPCVGKPAIRDFIGRYDERYRLRLHGLRHFTVNILSQIDGDLARSSAHLQLVSTGPKGVQILFTRRRLFQDMAGQPAAVPTPDGECERLSLMPAQRSHSDPPNLAGRPARQNVAARAAVQARGHAVGSH